MEIVLPRSRLSLWLIPSTNVAVKHDLANQPSVLEFGDGITINCTLPNQRVTSLRHCSAQRLRSFQGLLIKGEPSRDIDPKIFFRKTVAYRRDPDSCCARIEILGNCPAKTDSSK